MRYILLSLNLLPLASFAQEQQMANDIVQNYRQSNIQVQMNDLVGQNTANRGGNPYQVKQINLSNVSVENNTGDRIIITGGINGNPVNKQNFEWDNTGDNTQGTSMTLRKNNPVEKNKTNESLDEKINSEKISITSIKAGQAKSSAKKYRNVKKGYCQKGRVKKNKSGRAKNSRTSGMKCYKF